jgi:hypothetical protein
VVKGFLTRVLAVNLTARGGEMDAEEGRVSRSPCESRYFQEMREVVGSLTGCRSLEGIACWCQCLLRLMAPALAGRCELGP